MKSGLSAQEGGGKTGILQGTAEKDRCKDVVSNILVLLAFCLLS